MKTLKMDCFNAILKSVITGFETDCENFLHKFEALKTFDYTSFANVWTENNFSLVYTGKCNEEEARHFTELALFTAKKHLIYPKNLHVQVGAFYLLYGLYYKQTLREQVKIRFTHLDSKILKDLVAEMKHKDQSDFLYIYAKMSHDDVFMYTVTNCYFAPEAKHYVANFDLKDEICYDHSKQNLFKTTLGEILCSDITQQLSNTHDDYQKALQEYLDSNPGVAITVQSTSNVLDELQDIYDQAESGSSVKPKAVPFIAVTEKYKRRKQKSRQFKVK